MCMSVHSWAMISWVVTLPPSRRAYLALLILGFALPIWTNMQGKYEKNERQNQMGSFNTCMTQEDDWAIPLL